MLFCSGRTGHWSIRSKSAASKYTLLGRVGRKTADAVGTALIDMLLPLHAPVRTITSDNGKEIAGHAAVAEALGAGFFFATPYHSWERGLNEHVNGLVRQYFPKGTDFRQVADAQVKAAQDRTDARPRKALGYRTPAEAFRVSTSSSARTAPVCTCSMACSYVCQRRFSTMINSVGIVPGDGTLPSKW